MAILALVRFERRIRRIDDQIGRDRCAAHREARIIQALSICRTKGVRGFFDLYHHNGRCTPGGCGGYKPAPITRPFCGSGIEVGSDTTSPICGAGRPPAIFSIGMPRGMGEMDAGAKARHSTSSAAATRAAIIDLSLISVAIAEAGEGGVKRVAQIQARVASNDCYGCFKSPCQRARKVSERTFAKL
jgi:hypothetical protein